MIVAESENTKNLKQFFSKEYKSMRRYVRSKLTLTVDKEPDDIIQEVALKIFERADNTAPIKNVAAFVYHSIKNKIIDILRNEKKKTYLNDYIEEFIHEYCVINNEKPDNSYSEKMKSALINAISNLKPEYKNIIYAIDFECYTYKEISIETNSPVGTLLSRHHRAISLLMEQLEKFKY
jgi:RNA polymerase sigma-70 factor (ECF subfamily)